MIPIFLTSLSFWIVLLFLENVLFFWNFFDFKVMWKILLENWRPRSNEGIMGVRPWGKSPNHGNFKLQLPDDRLSGEHQAIQAENCRNPFWRHQNSIAFVHEFSHFVSFRDWGNQWTCYWEWTWTNHRDSCFRGFF